MIWIEINNNKIKLDGKRKIIEDLHERMKVRHPNQWYLRPYMEKGWDGKIKYITDAGYSKTGLFPMITSMIHEYNEEITIKDFRNRLDIVDIPDRVGTFTARPYQLEAVESIVHNTVEGIPFQRGIIAAATNAGKTLIAAMLYKTFVGAKALILVNNTDLYKQFLDDMPQMFGDDWGYMQGKKIRWGNIMVCMTPTLRNNLDRYRTKLAAYNMVLFDECHLITSKTNKKVVTFLYNTTIRVGLSGTPLDHKDPTKNMDVRAFFGDITYTISNIELMDMGYSTPIVVKIVEGNTTVKIKGDYDKEYREGITNNEDRTEKSLERIDYYLRRHCFPILVIGKYHEHVENLHEAIQERFGERYNIDYVHHKVKARKKILDKFKEGRVDILVASHIIKLGQNMPLIRYMQNASGGDSKINVKQLVGRSIRKHKSKKKVYYEDFWDEGFYLKRHSKHRILYLKKEGFKILELFKR